MFLLNPHKDYESGISFDLFVIKHCYEKYILLMIIEVILRGLENV